MSEHTPTPWKLDIETRETWSEGKVQSITIDTEDKLIATYETNFVEYPEAAEENAANAAFIVKAVNSHDVMVKVLEDIAEFCSGEDGKLGAVERLTHIRNSATTILAHVNAPVGGQKVP